MLDLPLKAGPPRQGRQARFGPCLECGFQYAHRVLDFRNFLDQFRDFTLKRATGTKLMIDCKKDAIFS